MVGVKEVGMLANPLKGFCGYHWYLEGLRILQLMSAHFTCAFLVPYFKMWPKAITV